MMMKLTLVVSILLSAIPTFVSSFASPVRVDDSIYRRFDPLRPIHEEPGRRPAPNDPNPIIEQYPKFLEDLEKFRVKDAYNMWLPHAENKEELLTRPDQGHSGVYIDGDRAIAQIGAEDHAAAYHNLISSKFVSWRPGDEDGSDDDLSTRQRAYKTLREQGRTIESLLGSESAARVRAQTKTPKYMTMGSFETATVFALERAAQLLAKEFGLRVEIRGSPVAQQKRSDFDDLRRSETDIRTVTPAHHRHWPAVQLHVRSSALDGIERQEQSAASGTTNSTTDLTTKIELYQYTLISIQNNISDLLFPFLDTIATKTNSELVYDVLWSVYQDLTGSSNLTGPFMSGWNCLDTLQDQYMNSTNTSSSSQHTINDTGTTEYLAVLQTVLDIYNFAWTNGSAAANQTGLLNELAAISNDIQSLNQSVVPPDFFVQSSFKNSGDYFQSRNPDVKSTAGVFFNFTLPLKN